MLSRAAIMRELEVGGISVTPTPRPEHIGPNSIDLHFGSKLYQLSANGRVPVIDSTGATYWAIDPQDPPPLVEVPLRPEGYWLLVPGEFYLGSTVERTKCVGFVPHLCGRSTAGRLSIEVHKTAGLGDNGFDGSWTLEVAVTEPVLVRPGDRLLQVAFSPCWDARVLDEALSRVDLYSKRDGHHYQGSTAARPPSKLTP